MGKTVMALALAGILIGSGAYAQTADLSRASCGQLLELPRNDRAQLIVWLHGYYAGAAQRPVLDRTRLEDSVTTIQELCERNRALPLIGAETRAVFLGEPLPGASQPSAASSGAPAPPSASPTR